jgi:hypothetical protein
MSDMHDMLNALNLAHRVLVSHYLCCLRSLSTVLQVLFVCAFHAGG